MARPEDTFPGEGSELTPDARTWAVISHLAAFAAVTSIPFANVLGPLVVWLIKRHDHPFIDENGKESLNFQISLCVYVVALFLLMLPVAFGSLFLPNTAFGLFGFAAAVPLFLIVFFGVAVFGAVMIVIAAIRANDGEVYRYPLTIRFVR